MNKKLLIATLLLALIPLTAAATYNEGDGFRIEGAQFNITGVSSDSEAAFFANEHGTFAIRDNDCIDRDIYLLCVENITDDIVENYPHRYSIEFTWDKLCDDCFAWGQECKNDSDKVCQNACVHGICRPREPWCGDSYCDEAESHRTCPEDCIDPATQNTSAQDNSSESEDEQTSTQDDTPDEQEDQQENQSVNEQANQQENTTPDEDVGIQERPADEQEEASADFLGANQDWLVGGLIIFGGIALIFVVFNRKKKPEEDLYSYRK